MPVNGIKLAAGQKWKTKNYGVVTLSERGVSSKYPWRMDFPNNGDPIGSITTDGKYWEEDEMPELLECIYNPEDKEEKKPMKFNPQPGDKIICNNGEEFICCTLETLISKGFGIYFKSKSDSVIFGMKEDHSGWMYWPYGSYLNDFEWNIREVIPQSSEVTDDKKEEVKEEPRYTVDEVFDALFEETKHIDIEVPWDYIDDIKEHLSRKNDPQYMEYLRLKAIYE